MLEESPMLKAYNNFSKFDKNKVSDPQMMGQRPSTTSGGHQADLGIDNKNVSRAKSSTGMRGNKGDYKLFPADVIYEKRTSSQLNS